jgi:lipopolysaccharide transport system permease protein
MLVHLRQITSYRALLVTWIARDVKIRYKQSALGVAWAILQPLTATLILALVFTRIVSIQPGGSASHILFYYAGMLPWTFFAAGISFGTGSLVSNMHLVTKIYFPREILPLASVAAGLVDFGIASLILVGLVVVYGAAFTSALALVPVALIIQVGFTTALVLAGSAVNVFFRDVRFIVPLATQLLMYLSPVIYPSTFVPERWRDIYMLNPIAVVIEIYRAAVDASSLPSPQSIITALVVTVLLLAGAYAYFKRVEPIMADMI